MQRQSISSSVKTETLQPTEILTEITDCTACGEVVNNNAELIAGLRILVDFLEDRPSLPTSYSSVSISFSPHSREEFTSVAHMIGSFKKNILGDELFEINRILAEHASLCSVGVSAYLNRSEVCEKVVTGTREVEETVMLSREEMTEEQRVVYDSIFIKQTITMDVVEWKCPESILAGSVK